MSRHRNVRSMNYSDEYDGYDDVYGHSVEDDYTISPSDAAFMYDRNRQPQQMAAFLNEEDDIAEVDESELDSENAGPQRRDSETYHRPALSEIDEARLRSCLDEIRNVLGETVSEQVLVETVLKYEFNVAKALDDVLSNAASTAKIEDPHSKRQRERRDIGKDQDENTEPLRHANSIGEIIENKDVTDLRKGVAQLAIKKPSQHSETTPKASGNNLSDELAKRLQPSSSSKLNLPKFQFKKSNQMKGNSSDEDEDQGSLFSLVSKHKKITTSENKFTSLADRANEHLKTNPLPQIFSSNRSTSTFAKDQGSLRDSKFGSKHISNGDENEPSIDLSCALKSAESRRHKLDIGQESVAQIHSTFVDDGLVERLSKLHCVEEFNCAENARHIVEAQVPRAKSVSSFGKVVCRRWAKRFSPLLNKRQREVLHEINRFDFLTPSPDDLVKKHLRRNLK